MEEKKYYVYVHTNKTNGKKYFGITCQKPIKRWNRGNGYISSVMFYRAIQKYTWNGFEHEILFSGLSENEAKQKEIELIANYNTTDDNFGYNISKGGTSTPHTDEQKQTQSERMSNGKSWWCGRKHTDETKRLIGEANGGENSYWYGKTGAQHPVYGHPNSEASKEKYRSKMLGTTHAGKPVNQIDIKTGYIIGTYNTIKQASNATGCNASKICDCCNGKRKHTGGYSWSYQDGVSKTQRTYRKVNGIVKLDLNNNFVEVFPATTEAAQNVGVTNHSILSVCKGERHTAGGFKWMYIEDYEQLKEKVGVA